MLNRLEAAYLKLDEAGAGISSEGDENEENEMANPLKEVDADRVMIEEDKVFRTVASAEKYPGEVVSPFDERATFTCEQKFFRKEESPSIALQVGYISNSGKPAYYSVQINDELLVIGTKNDGSVIFEVTKTFFTNKNGVGSHVFHEGERIILD